MVFVPQHDDRVSAFASRHWHSVARGACVLYQRDVTDGMRSPWKIHRNFERQLRRWEHRRNPNSVRAGDLTRCDGKVEKDCVTLGDEVNGEITFVKLGHDVEHVTAVLKNPYRNVI